MVSVIIPTYNVEKYIIECLESVLTQTYKNFEIIIVDNNSSDSTVSICKRFKNIYPETINLIFEEKQGAAFARNSGLRIAKGEWIQFLDADDLLKPKKLETQLKHANHSNGFLVGSWEYKSINQVTSKRLVEKNDIIKAVFAGQGCGNTCANLWSKKALENVGGFNEFSDTDDYFLMLNLAINADYKPVFLNEVLTTIRQREDGSHYSNSDLLNHLKRHVEMRLEFMQILEKKNIEYYLVNRQFFYACIFKTIRKIYNYDRREGVNADRNYIPNNIKIKYFNQLNSSRMYLKLRNLMGLEFIRKLGVLKSKLLC